MLDVNYEQGKWSSARDPRSGGVPRVPDDQRMGDLAGEDAPRIRRLRDRLDAGVWRVRADVFDDAVYARRFPSGDFRVAADP